MLVLPLGYLALFTATTVFGLIQVGWLAEDLGVAASVAVLGVTVATQVIASAVGFAVGDNTAGTAMGVLAGTWAAVAVTTLMAGRLRCDPALGVVLVCSGVALLVVTFAGRHPPVAGVVIGTSGLRFIITGIAEVLCSPGWTVGAGIAGLVLAVVSLYGAVALMGTDRGWSLPLSRS